MMIETRKQTISALGVLSIGNIVFLIALIAIETFIAERNWLATFITYMPQHPFGVPLALLTLWSILRRDKKAILINSISLALFVFILLGLQLPMPTFSKHSGMQVRLMTYNIHRSQGGGAQIAAAITDAAPDVVCLQEANALIKWSDAKRETLRMHPDWHVAEFDELVTLSRYPIVRQEIIKLASSVNRHALLTVHNVNGKMINILNVHLNTAVKGRSLAHSDISHRDYLRHTAGIRSDQVAGILRILQNRQSPTIVAGDFNTPPRGRIYRRIARAYTDAFVKRGLGWGYTYKASLPLMRIDYIFLSGGITAKSCSVVSASTSDHKPIIADLIIH